MKLEHNYEETVIRDICNTEGKILIRNAVFARTITDRFLGIEGKIPQNADNIFSFGSSNIKHDQGVTACQTFLCDAEQQRYTLVVADSLRINHLVDWNERFGFHMTTKATAPRAIVLAKHPYWKFILLIAHATDTPYLALWNGPTATLHHAGLPNVYGDSRLCTGNIPNPTSTAIIRSKYDGAGILETVLDSEWNNHLIAADAPSLTQFWKFTTTGMWMPSTPPGPAHLPIPHELLITATGT